MMPFWLSISGHLNRSPSWTHYSLAWVWPPPCISGWRSAIPTDS